jgi:hypothetical protein
MDDSHARGSSHKDLLAGEEDRKRWGKKSRSAQLVHCLAGAAAL